MVDIFNKRCSVKPRQIQTEFLMPTVSCDYFRIQTHQEYRFRQSVTLNKFFKFLPLLIRNTCGKTSELTVTAIFINRKLGSGINTVYFVLPVFHILLISSTVQICICAKNIFFKCKIWFTYFSIWIVVNLLPLPEYVEHAPSVKEHIVKTDKQPPFVVLKLCISKVIRRPCIRIKYLIWQFISDLR